MAVSSNLYLHESDKAALQTLKAIPGFSQLLKTYMSIWNERYWHIINMSSNLRLSEKQMSKYYNMLPPICEKLGIDVPELYLELDVQPNSYTYGDTKPFIVITSGLLETLPDELIPTVLAHECGHIACHHVLYRTMGDMILNGMCKINGLASLVTVPIQVAFAYWMRCSELSADRVAAICDGSPDKMIEVCMRFAGYDKDILADANTDAFMEQAIAYKEMIVENKWDKTLEFLYLAQVDHPFNAVRAYECKQWGATEQYKHILGYMENSEGAWILGKELPMRESSKFYMGKNYLEAQKMLQEEGFTSVQTVKTREKGLMTKEGQVVGVKIDEKNGFNKDEWFSENAKITLIYYETETAEEAALAHAGKIQTPEASKKYCGRNYHEVLNELSDAGFTQIITESMKVKKGLLTKTDSITKISISGQNQFEKGAWFSPDAIVRIVYQEIE